MTSTGSTRSESITSRRRRSSWPPSRRSGGPASSAARLRRARRLTTRSSSLRGTRGISRSSTSSSGPSGPRTRSSTTSEGQTPHIASKFFNTPICIYDVNTTQRRCRLVPLPCLFCLDCLLLPVVHPLLDGPREVVHASFSNGVEEGDLDLPSAEVQGDRLHHGLDLRLVHPAARHHLLPNLLRENVVHPDLRAPADLDVLHVQVPPVHVHVDLAPHLVRQILERVQLLLHPISGHEVRQIHETSQDILPGVTRSWPQPRLVEELALRTAPNTRRDHPPARQHPPAPQHARHPLPRSRPRPFPNQTKILTTASNLSSDGSFESQRDDASVCATLLRIPRPLLQIPPSLSSSSFDLISSSSHKSKEEQRERERG
mmetsp:Transcript_11914/g.32933  ORF Transcript_11914/g.32933 Transcript_11914/m.32933 type:complete len:373 (-) Transcript_11914:2-1120(-)